MCAADASSADVEFGERVRRLEAEIGALRRALEPSRNLPTVAFDALEVNIAGSPWLIAIAAIREVLPRLALTAIPDAPTWVVGGFSYAGRTVAVVDLASRLYRRPANAGAEGFVVFVDRPRWTGLFVDGVGRIVHVAPTALTSPPAGVTVSTLLQATVTIDGLPASLLSLDHVTFEEASDVGP